MATALKESQVSVLPPNELKDKMDICAQLTGRAKSFVAMEALTEYLDGRVPQTEDLKAGVGRCRRRRLCKRARRGIGAVAL